METLTHGLLGAAVAAVPLPRWLITPDTSPHAALATLLAAVLAAELPDLDYLLPAGDAVLHTLQAHRGLTHALVAAPVVALVAALLAKAAFRATRWAPLYVRALLAVPLAHLLPDLWTGWGTRVLLPFSDTRLALDWTMVIDPFFTVPLLVAAAYALLRRSRWGRGLLLGLAISGLYLGLRIGLSLHLSSVVRGAYPGATDVQVFPAPLSLLRWRYVTPLGTEYAAGSVSLGSAPEEEARVARLPSGSLPPALAAIPTVREALAWARFPVVRLNAAAGSDRRLEIADLRYHLHGKPTLTFVISVASDGTVTGAHLDRGGTGKELIRRWLNGGRK